MRDDEQRGAGALGAELARLRQEILELSRTDPRGAFEAATRLSDLLQGSVEDVARLRSIVVRRLRETEGLTLAQLADRLSTDDHQYSMQRMSQLVNYKGRNDVEPEADLRGAVGPGR